MEKNWLARRLKKLGYPAVLRSFLKEKTPAKHTPDTIKSASLAKVDELEKKLERDFADATAEFYETAHLTFIELLRLKRGYTFEEVISALSKKRLSPETKSDLHEFLEKINAEEYTSRRKTVQEIRELMSEFKEILKKA